MTRRELVLARLSGERTPRPPVICPGGMMSFAVTAVMEQTGLRWPQAHGDAEAMAGLANAMQQAADFDNIGVPFCMTVEAEALGAQVDYGTSEVQPRIAREPLDSPAEISRLATDQATADNTSPQPDRRPATLEAIRQLRSQDPEAAIVGGVVGPVSLAGQLLEASLLLRAMQRDAEAAHALIEKATQVVGAFALDQVTAGADVIMLADPTATGEIIGGRRYREFAEPYIQAVIDAIRHAGAPVILHICGNARTVLPALAEADVEAVSVDETVDLREARRALANHRLMGNISADLLMRGPPRAIEAAARRALDAGVDILAPACGVIPATPVEHLRVLSAVAHSPTTP